MSRRGTRVAVHGAARGAHVALGGAIAVAALVLAGCGSGDSTVSGTPDSPTVAPPPSAGERSSATKKPDDNGFPESPEPVPSDAPGLETPQVGAREKAFLDELDSSGIDTKDLRIELVSAGNNICRIRATGGAADDTTVLANAMAGQLVEAGAAKGDPETVAQQIVDTSVAQLCP